MGMYDSVYARCDNCGTSLEFQSKAGDCILSQYTSDDVPIEIALDISGEEQQCDCGKFVRLNWPEVPKPRRVNMHSNTNDSFIGNHTA